MHLFGRRQIGNPVVVTVNVPDAPTVNVVLSSLVIAGDWSPTVSVKIWLALLEPRRWRR